MQIKRITVGLISVLLLGGIVGIRQSLELAGKPNSAIEISDAAIQISVAPEQASMQAESSRNVDAMTPRVAVSYKQGLLSIDARRAALRDVLVAVTQVTGATFAAHDDTGQAVTVAVGPAPLQQAIADLIQRVGYGYALIAGDHQTQDSSSVHVFLFPQGGEVRSPPASEWTPNASVPAEAGLAQIHEVRPALMDSATMLQHRVFDQIMEACKQQECDAS